MRAISSLRCSRVRHEITTCMPVRASMRASVALKSVDFTIAPRAEQVLRMGLFTEAGRTIAKTACEIELAGWTLI